MLLTTAYDWLSIDASMRYKWMKVNEYHFEWVNIVAMVKYKNKLMEKKQKAKTMDGKGKTSNRRLYT